MLTSSQPGCKTFPYPCHPALMARHCNMQVDEAACCPACCPEFNFQKPHGGRRPDHTSCPLTLTCMHTCTTTCPTMSLILMYLPGLGAAISLTEAHEVAAARGGLSTTPEDKHSVPCPCPAHQETLPFLVLFCSLQTGSHSVTWSRLTLL